jgi:hypothetical protein
MRLPPNQSAQILLENIYDRNLFRATSDDLTGNYLFYIPNKDQYEFTVKAPGYISFVEDISMQTFEKEANIHRNIYLTPIENSASIYLE